MIELIASDIDGTLLTHGARAISPRVFTCIHALRPLGVRFCAASGRQYTSLRRLFAPVADEIFYICENGAIVYGDGPQAAARVLCKTPMPRALAERLIREILAREECEVLISGANTSYVMPKRVDMAARMRDFTGNNVRTVARCEDIPEDIVKISAFSESAERLQPVLRPQWEAHFSVAVAGREWLDFTLADKSTGMRGLCGALGVAPRDVLALGDNFNDVPLLDMVGRPWMMAGAAPALLARYPNHCADVADVLEAALTYCRAQSPASNPAQAPASNPAQSPAPKPAQTPASSPAPAPALNPAQAPASNPAQSPAVPAAE